MYHCISYTFLILSKEQINTVDTLDKYAEFWTVLLRYFKYYRSLKQHMKKSAEDLNINQLNAFALQLTLCEEVLIQNKKCFNHTQGSLIA